MAASTHAGSHVAERDRGAAATGSASGGPADLGQQRRSSVRRFGRLLRRSHLLFGLIFGAGVLLRIATVLAYRPAFIYPDSGYYLAFTATHKPGDSRVTGYSLLMRPVLAAQGLDLVVILQHLAGLLLGFVIYRFLLHWRCPRLWAAIAALPVLLDPLQVVLEHYVLTDVPAEFLMTAGLVLLGWRRRTPGAESPDHSGWVVAGVTGLLFSAATLVRSASVLLIVIAVGYIVLSRPTWRRRIGHAVIACLAFITPIAAYAGWMHNVRGSYSLTHGWSGHFLYGRVAQFADCTGLSLPANERSLCPRNPTPAEQNYYMWDLSSPQWKLQKKLGVSSTQANAILTDFGRRIVLHQPGAYAETVGKDFLANFDYHRTRGPENLRAWYFTYQKTYPADPVASQKTVDTYGGSDVVVHPVLTTPLHLYGSFFTPGILPGIGVLLSLLAGAGLTRRARRSGMRLVSLLIGVGLVVVLLVPAALSAFSLRYTISVLPLGIMAGVLGVTALLTRRGLITAPDTQTADPTT